MNTNWFLALIKQQSSQAKTAWEQTNFGQTRTSQTIYIRSNQKHYIELTDVYTVFGSFIFFTFKYFPIIYFNKIWPNEITLFKMSPLHNILLLLTIFMHIVHAKILFHEKIPSSKKIKVY